MISRIIKIFSIESIRETRKRFESIASDILSSKICFLFIDLNHLVIHHFSVYLILFFSLSDLIVEICSIVFTSTSTFHFFAHQISWCSLRATEEECNDQMILPVLSVVDCDDCRASYVRNKYETLFWYSFTDVPFFFWSQSKLFSFIQGNLGPSLRGISIADDRYSI